MNGQLLLTLVDHGKPFKGTWKIYKEADNRYAACHGRSTAASDQNPPSCQAFLSTRQVCRFAELLQFHGWAIDRPTPESQRFLQACAL